MLFAGRIDLKFSPLNSNRSLGTIFLRGHLKNNFFQDNPHRILLFSRPGTTLMRCRKNSMKQHFSAQASQQRAAAAESHDAGWWHPHRDSSLHRLSPPRQSSLSAVQKEKRARPQRIPGAAVSQMGSSKIACGEFFRTPPNYD